MSSEAQKKFGYPLPEDEFTEDTQSYCVTIPAGYEYTQAFLAQLDMLGKWWFWKRDDDRPNAASDAATTWRTLLNIEEDCGGFDMSPEELTQAICDGLVCAAPRIGLMLASGKSTGADFDEDGNIIPPSSGTDDEDLPEDDPATPAIDENMAARAGGAIAVRIGLNDVWARLNTLYTNGVTEPNAQSQIGALYLWNDVAQSDAIVTAYYTARNTAQPFVPSTGFAVTIDPYLYCKGITGQNILEWILEVQTANLQGMSSLINGLSQEQRDIWFNRGIEIPSTDYKGYSCTPIADETGQLDFSLSNAPQFITAGVWKPGHRFLITVTDTFTDSDNANVVYDGMWEHNTSTGAKQFNPLSFSSGGGVPLPLQANVPFESSHSYQFTVDKSPTSAAAVCTIQGNNGSAGLPNTVGIVTVTVKDLGEFAL